MHQETVLCRQVVEVQVMGEEVIGEVGKSRYRSVIIMLFLQRQEEVEEVTQVRGEQMSSLGLTG